MKLLEKIDIDFALPYLVALFPFAHLATINIKEIQLITTLRTFLIIIIFVFLAGLLMNFLIKNRLKASLILSLLITVGFSFGHLVSFIKKFVLVGDRYVFIAVFLLCFVLIWKILKIKKIPSDIAKYTALPFAILILISILRVVVYSVSFPSKVKDYSENITPFVSQKENLPDIYYIILDGHARTDVLEELFGYKKHFLTDYLKTKGFYVAEKSNANYLFSFGSDSSSLNYDYLDNLIKNFDINNVDSTIWNSLIQNSHTAQKLKSLGYTYYTIRSEFSPLQQNPVANVHFAQKVKLNSFEISFINNSILRYVLNLFFDFTKSHKEEVLFSFEALREISHDQKPTFTYAHIVSPHAPFIFDSEGNYIGEGKNLSFVENPLKEGKNIEEYREMYLNQLIFIDKKTVETIDSVLSNSPTPPIIILQSDHGPVTERHFQKDWTELALKERSGILNAYYLTACNSQPYPTITPINTFRLIFRSCFGENLEFLEDKTIVDFPNNQT